MGQKPKSQSINQNHDTFGGQAHTQKKSFISNIEYGHPKADTNEEIFEKK